MTHAIKTEFYIRSQTDMNITQTSNVNRICSSYGYLRNICITLFNQHHIQCTKTYYYLSINIERKCKFFKFSQNFFSPLVLSQYLVLIHNFNYSLPNVIAILAIVSVHIFINFS